MFREPVVKQYFVMLNITQL